MCWAPGIRAFLLVVMTFLGLFLLAAQVLAQFGDWRDPSVRHGVLPRLLDAVEAYCERTA